MQRADNQVGLHFTSLFEIGKHHSAVNVIDNQRSRNGQTICSVSIIQYHYFESVFLYQQRIILVSFLLVPKRSRMRHPQSVQYIQRFDNTF
ncbi:hypothetical protein D3C80_1528130 [compost metagenome]